MVVVLHRRTLRIAVPASLSSIALLHRLYGAGSIALGCEKKMLSPAERLALVGGCARHGASYASRARVRHVCRAQRAAASRAVLRAVSDALLYRCSRRHAAHERTPFAFGWSPSARAGTAVTEQSLFFCGRKDGKLVALRHMVREGLRPPVLFFVQSVERAMQPFFVLVYVYNVPGAQSEATVRVPRRPSVGAHRDEARGAQHGLFKGDVLVLEAQAQADGQGIAQVARSRCEKKFRCVGN